MANAEHIAILKQGAKVWNQWRTENSTVRPDLSEANLSGAYLIGMNLTQTKLNKATLIGAQITGAHLSGAILIGANLSQANLSSAIINLASLTGADLSKSILHSADLSRSNLTGVNLSGANLAGVKLSGAYLRWTDWTGTLCNDTSFGNIDLNQVKGLETVIHNGPSSIGIDTIYQSGGNIPEVFLRGAGVPDNFIAYMKSLTSQALEFYSCFISHSSKDREFVERLYADLQANGVRCWYAPEDLKIGQPFLLGIEEGIRLHEKLLLVLSENSVGSNWVQHEVLSAMAKEQGKEPWVLFPIRVDNAVTETNVLWASMIRQSRHIGDFSQWKDHDSYRKALDRLLRDLKAGE